MLGIALAWTITPPATYMLGFKLGWGAVGGWIGLSAEIIAGGFAFWWRLWSGGWKASAEASRAAVAEEVSDVLEPAAAPAA